MVVLFCSLITLMGHMICIFFYKKFYIKSLNVNNANEKIIKEIFCFETPFLKKISTITSITKSHHYIFDLVLIINPFYTIELNISFFQCIKYLNIQNLVTLCIDI